MTLRLCAAWVGALALLAACGGGGGGSDAPTVAVSPPAPDAPVVPAPAPGPSAPAPASPAPPSEPQDAACTAERQRESLQAWMRDEYYWTAQAGTPQAATLPAYFDSLLDKSVDRYSYAEPTSAHDAQFILGRRLGYGYTLVWADAAQTALKIRQVEPQSPAARAGLQRGDTVLSIDGLSPALIARGLPGAVTAAGVARVFRLRDVAGQERTVTVLSAEFPLSAVTAVRVHDVARAAADGRTDQVKVGYLAYQSFVTYGFLELGDAFKQFASAGVQEVVLDLRYNGGGSVNIARDLASMVGGATTAGERFAELRFNARNPGRNLDIRYATIPAALPAPPLAGLRRVLVITSNSTASASELLINGLKPFLPVVIIGETTFGKPYGFAPRDNCGTTYNAVNFEAFNARGVGGFTAGFAPDCPAPDDLNRAPGDPLEARTRAALAYVATGRCEAQAPQSLADTRPSPVFGEAGASTMYVD